MLKAIGMRSVGGACKRGIYYPGFGQVDLSNGKQLYVPSDESKGLQSILNFATERGVDTTDMQAKLDNWVKTGEGFSFNLTQ